MSQYVQLRLNPVFDCTSNPDQLCVTLEIRSASAPNNLEPTGTETPFAIGSSAVYITYNENALTFQNYNSFTFNETVVCTPPGVALYEPLSVDALQAGIVNAVIAYTNTSGFFGFGCPEVTECWLPVYELCFEITNSSLTSEFVFSDSNTSFNTDINDGLSQVPEGLSFSLDIPLDCSYVNDCDGSLTITADAFPYDCGPDNDDQVSINFSTAGGSGCYNFYNTSGPTPELILSDDGSSVVLTGYEGDQLSVSVTDQNGCEVGTSVTILCACGNPLTYEVINQECQDPPSYWEATVGISGGYNFNNDNYYVVEFENGNIINVAFDGQFSDLISNCNGDSFTVTDQYGCTVDGIIPAFNCPIVPPTDIDDVIVCSGNNSPAIVVAGLAGFDIRWFTNADGTGQVYQGSSFDPDFYPNGIYYVGYYNSVCNSDLTAFEVAIYDPIEIAIISQPTCNASLDAYSFSFSITGGDDDNYVIDAGTYNYTISNGIYTISDIDLNDDVTLNVSSLLGSSTNECVEDLFIAAPSCACDIPTLTMQDDEIYHCPELNATEYPTLVVNDPGGLFTVWWLENANDTEPLWEGNSFVPGIDGVYYAMVTDGVNCFGTPVPIELASIDPIVVDVGDPVCSGTQNYDVSISITGGYPPDATTNAYSLESGIFDANPVGNDVFEFTNVSIGSDLNITITSSYFCNGFINIPSVPDDFCSCPTIVAPIIDSNFSLCDGEPLPALSVASVNNYEVSWFQASNPVAIASGLSFSPTSIGNYSVQYTDPITECSSEFVPFEIAYIEPLIITIGNTNCSIDLTSYTAQFSVTGLEPISFDNPAVVNLGNNLYQLANIETGQDISINVTDGSGCSAPLSITSPTNCNCPTITSPATQSFEVCNDISTYPLLVSMPLGLQNYDVFWYSDPSGSNPPVHQGISYPNAPIGIYYVRYESLDNDCSSGFGTVAITQLPVVIGGFEVPACAADNESFSTILNISGGSGQGYVVNGLGSIEAASNNVFNISLLSVDNPEYLFDIEDDFGCTATVSISTPECGLCPPVPQPIVPNQYYCNGTTMPTITVPPPPSGYESYSPLWYSDFNAVLPPISSGFSFIPSVDGTYYVTYASGDCESANADPVTIAQYEPIQVIGYVANCSPDITNYSFSFTITSGSNEIESVELIPSNEGTLSFTPPNIVQVMNVPTGVNVDLLITDEENCQLTYSVFSPQCDCPPVPQPINPIVNTVCTNDPGPYLVSVEGTDPISLIEWYDGPDYNTATLLGNSPSILALTQEPIYVFNIINGCYSDPLEITIPLGEAITFDGDHSCFMVNEVYTLTYSFEGPAIESISISPANLNPIAIQDFYQISSIPFSTIVLFDVVDVNGCTYQFEYIDDCSCNDIPQPITEGSYFFCSGELSYDISIDANYDASLTPTWLDEAGNILGHNDVLSVNTPGLYSVYFENLIGCVGPSITTEVFINDELVITDIVGNCNSNLQYYYSFNLGLANVGSYSATLEISQAAVTITDMGNGFYETEPVSSMENIVLNFTTVENCQWNETLDAVNCDCPAIPTPLAIADLSLCYDESIPEIIVDDLGLYEVLWSDDEDGLNVLYTGTNYTPLNAGVYYVFYRDTQNSCLSAGTFFALDIAAELSIINPVTNCNDQLSYTLTVQASGGSGLDYVLLAESYDVIDNGNGEFEVSLPSNTGVNLLLADSQGCEAELLINAVNCNCGIIPSPLPPADVFLCNGDAFPVLTAATDPGLEIIWSDDTQGLNVLGTGENFIPSNIGTYYVLAIDPASNCKSESQAVVVAMYDAIITEYSYVCNDNFLTDYTITVQGGSGAGYSVIAGTYQVVDNMDGSFIISDIPYQEQVSLTIQDGAACSLVDEIIGQDCAIDCTPLNFTFNTTSSYYCTNDSPIDLQSLINTNIANSGQWTSANSGISLLDDLLELNGVEPGAYTFVYTVTPPVEEADVCPSYSDSLILNIVENQAVELMNDLTICNTELGIIQLDDYIISGSNIEGSWSSNILLPINGIDGSYDMSGQVVGNYIFEFTPVETDCIESANLNLEIIDCEIDKSYYLPSAFSPNNDGVNDVFRPVVIGESSFQEMMIFNRWGEKVYAEKGTTEINGWNGLLDGREQDIAVYTYIYRINLTGQLEEVKGNLTLVR